MSKKASYRGRPIAPSSQTQSEPGFLYHATSDDYVDDIAHDGRLKVHAPWHGTDQDTWPDGSTEKRSYWHERASVVHSFAPDHGRPVILRARLDRVQGARKERGTGDTVTTKPVLATDLEILTDLGWEPLVTKPNPHRGPREAPITEWSPATDKVPQFDRRRSWQYKAGYNRASWDLDRASPHTPSANDLVAIDALLSVEHAHDKELYRGLDLIGMWPSYVDSVQRAEERGGSIGPPEHTKWNREGSPEARRASQEQHDVDMWLWTQGYIQKVLDVLERRNGLRENAGNAGAPTRRGGRAEEIQEILTQRVAAGVERCDDACPGWFVDGYGEGIQRCDECNHYAMEAGLPSVDDDDVALLPEAQAALVTNDYVENPGPEDADKAVEKYREFHRYDPKKAVMVELVVPARLHRAGKAKWVTYRSGKVDPATMQKPKSTFDYIHEHDAGVETFISEGDPDTDVPTWARGVTAVVQLGKCLGFCFVDPDGEICEARGTEPLPDLCCTPDGRALLVVQNRKQVIAMMWGGALGVFARGIDG